MKTDVNVASFRSRYSTLPTNTMTTDITIQTALKQFLLLVKCISRKSLAELAAVEHERPRNDYIPHSALHPSLSRLSQHRPPSAVDFVPVILPDDTEWMSVDEVRTVRHNLHHQGAARQPLSEDLYDDTAHVTGGRGRQLLQQEEEQPPRPPPLRRGSNREKQQQQQQEEQPPRPPPLLRTSTREKQQQQQQQQDLYDDTAHVTLGRGRQQEQEQLQQEEEEEEPPRPPPLLRASNREKRPAPAIPNQVVNNSESSPGPSGEKGKPEYANGLPPLPGQPSANPTVPKRTLTVNKTPPERNKPPDHASGPPPRPDKLTPSVVGSKESMQSYKQPSALSPASNVDQTKPEYANGLPPLPPGVTAPISNKETKKAQSNTPGTAQRKYNQIHQQLINANSKPEYANGLPPLPDGAPSLSPQSRRAVNKLPLLNGPRAPKASPRKTTQVNRATTNMSPAVNGVGTRQPSIKAANRPLPSPPLGHNRTAVPMQTTKDAPPVSGGTSPVRSTNSITNQSRPLPQPPSGSTERASVQKATSVNEKSPTPSRVASSVRRLPLPPLPNTTPDEGKFKEKPGQSQPPTKEASATSQSTLKSKPHTSPDPPRAAGSTSPSTLKTNTNEKPPNDNSQGSPGSSMASLRPAAAQMTSPAVPKATIQNTVTSPEIPENTQEPPEYINNQDSAIMKNKAKADEIQEVASTEQKSDYINLSNSENVRVHESSEYINTQRMKTEEDETDGCPDYMNTQGSRNTPEPPDYINYPKVTTRKKTDICVENPTSPTSGQVSDLETGTNSLISADPIHTSSTLGDANPYNGQTNNAIQETCNHSDAQTDSNEPHSDVHIPLATSHDNLISKEGRSDILEGVNDSDSDSDSDDESEILENVPSEHMRRYLRSLHHSGVQEEGPKEPPAALSQHMHRYLKQCATKL